MVLGLHGSIWVTICIFLILFIWLEALALAKNTVLKFSTYFSRYFPPGAEQPEQPQQEQEGQQAEQEQQEQQENHQRC